MSDLAESAPAQGQSYTIVKVQYVRYRTSSMYAIVQDVCTLPNRGLSAKAISWRNWLDRNMTSDPRTILQC